ncbi:unnamed protein product [Pedinophyceae sp. YPF-701]|nr:unnamed protein product [Pedinophyceae sp. YPF-701]
MRRNILVAIFLFALLGAFAIPVARAETAEPAAAEGDAASDEPARPPRESETFTFQAEVKRLLDMIINSLYSHREIFLRELISNASDALDKLRFIALTDPKVMEADDGSTPDMEIRISADKEKKVLYIRDSGIGMTKDDLVQNLGTIAKSGTSSFLDKFKDSGDANLIGQFGVGFYSVYLVADHVEVVTKHSEDKQYIWESTADGSFAITEDKENEPLGRGTMLKLHLKKDAEEFLEPSNLEALVHKYSEFINFPILLEKEKEVEVEVPVEDDEVGEDEADAEDDAEKEGDEDAEDAEDEEGDEEAKTRTEKRKVREWEKLNPHKAMWLRSPSEISEEEYDDFFKALTKGSASHLAHSHFKAEGDVEFRALLYVPKSAPWDFYDNFYQRQANVKLYVRRVFITDDYEDMLPRYLSFLVGVIDSDTLPLNISREQLQQSQALKTIKKKLVRKALDMIKKLADDERRARARAEGEDGEEGEEGGDGKDLEAVKSQYSNFWNEFGKALKMGIIEDAANRHRLAKLLRFHSSASPDELTSLDDYIGRMKEGQKNIFYVSGGSMDELKKSPFVERLIKKGYEVIFFGEPADEFMMQSLVEFDDFKFQNASKEDLKIDDREEKKAFKKIKEEFKPLVKWWKEALASESDLDQVKVSNRLAETPCVVVTSKYGWSAQMEKLMKAQALANNQKHAFMRGRKTLEINPHHPMVQYLKDQVADAEEGEASAEAAMTAKVMYQVALLESGFDVADPQAFSRDVYSVLRRAAGDEAIPEPDAKADDQLDAEAEAEQPEAEEQDGDVEGGEEDDYEEEDAGGDEHEEL